MIKSYEVTGKFYRPDVDYAFSLTKNYEVGNKGEASDAFKAETAEMFETFSDMEFGAVKVAKGVKLEPEVEFEPDFEEELPDNEDEYSEEDYAEYDDDVEYSEPVDLEMWKKHANNQAE